LDPQSLFFVLLVIALGGIAAYTADILGYKIGKKRLSIKRIRPKYVARISVVIAGMLIPLITMTLLYAVSSTFRTWFTRGSEIVRDLEQKSKEVSKINSQLVEGERQNARLANSNKFLQNSTAQNDALLKKSNIEVDAQKKKLAELQASVKQAELKVAQANQERSKARSQYEVASAKLTTINAQLKKDKLELEQAQDNYKKAAVQYGLISSKNLELTSKNSTLQKANEDIELAKNTLVEQVKNLGADIDTLRSQKTSAEADTKKAQSALSAASAQYDEVLQKLADAQFAARVALNDQDRFYRTKAISFVIDEEMSRMPIPPNPSQVQAEEIYRTLIRRAKTVASSGGAKPGNPYFSGTAGVATADRKTGRDLSEAETEQFYVSEIRKLNQDTLIIARSIINFFDDESVVLRLEFKANPIVFRKGEIITETKIDGRSSEIEILNSIREFLRAFVNTRARVRKMIAVQAKDGDSFGEFTQDQLLRAVASVKAVTRQARLVAIAKQDTRAGDPLEITLEVR